MIKSGVYVIQNTQTGKRYVGSSARCVYNRYKNHRAMLNGNRHDNIYLQRAWNKYGESSFTFKVVRFCIPTACLEVEQKFIDLFKTCNPKYGYNRCPVAGSTLGITHSAEIRKRMGDGKIGIMHTEEAKAKISAAHLGRKLSEEHKANIWKNRKGWRHSEDSKKKISNSVRKLVARGIITGPIGYHHTEEAKSKISKTHKGKPQTKEQVAKRMAATKLTKLKRKMECQQNN